jgi:nucleotide-binding universal stress UspA family protein
MQAIRKILVPTSFTALSDEAFRVAQSLARALQAKVILFHVARDPAVVSEGGPLLAHPSNGKASNLWDRFHGYLSNDPEVHVEHEVIVAHRPRAGHILEILDKLGCDLIVMGTHGHRALRNLLFGSLTQQVLRQARCPVLMVKLADHKARTGSHRGISQGAGGSADLESERSKNLPIVRK